MAKIHSIKELNEKIWYRLTKVIYILCFAIILLAIVWINFNQIGTYQTDTLITCTYGNKKSFLAYKNKELYLSYDYSTIPKTLSQNSVNEIIKYCELSEKELASTYGITSDGNSYQVRPFTTQEVKVNEFTYLSAILWSILYIIIAISIFELIKKTFYYIVLGKLKPNKE
jgi:hypothetical protein